MKIENENAGILTTDFSTKNTEAQKATYRTKSKSGNIAEIPDKLPVITNSKYQNALTFNKNDTAYLQMISCTDTLNYKDGILLYKGLPITDADLNSLYTEDGIKNINLSLLRALYGIILNIFYKPHQKNQIIDSTIAIYYPEFARKIGKASNIGKNDVNEFIKNIEHLQTIVGIISNGTGSNDVLPVMLYVGHNTERNTISFMSPYITEIIKNIHKASIKRTKNGTPLLKKNGKPQMLPSYSYLVDMTITKEKNKKAIEIVLIVVALIEQAGTNTPHICVQTIIQRNRLLSESLKGQSSGNKNTILKRAFKKAWELLSNKTYLTTVYKNIQLPDPDDISSIPTNSTLDKVFEFPHEGKIKSS